MLNNLLTVTGQVATLFLMMAVGFGLGKMKKLSSAGLSQMSFLLLYIVCPCVMIECFQVERTPELVQQLCVGAVIAVACYLVYLAISMFFFRRCPADTRDSLRFAMVYGNVGFMGVPLVQSILGSEALVYGALSLAAFNVTTWTLGVVIMGGKQAFSLKKAIINPGVIGLAVSLVIFFGGFRFPDAVSSTISFLGDLNTPLAMIVIGAQLAAADLGGAFRQPVLYLASFLKLILVPGLTALVLLPFGLPAGLYCALVLLAATPVAGTTSIFAQQFGRDTVPGVQVITLSTLLSIITLPVFAVIAKTISGF
mgnify:FL=1